MSQRLSLEGVSAAISFYSQLSWWMEMHVRDATKGVSAWARACISGPVSGALPLDSVGLGVGLGTVGMCMDVREVCVTCGTLPCLCHQ